MSSNGAGLTRRSRLRSPIFGQVLKSGNFLRGRSVAILVKPNHLPWARIGIVVPKKILPRAVDRNRCKRIMREWFRGRQSEMSGNDWIIRLLRKPETVGTAMLRELERLLPTP